MINTNTIIKIIVVVVYSHQHYHYHYHFHHHHHHCLPIECARLHPQAFTQESCQAVAGRWKSYRLS